MTEWIKNVMNTLGYPGIALLMLLENVFPPIPSELIMPLAGFTAKQGQLSLIGVVIAGMIGSVVGALPLYYLGKLVGEERLKDLADRYGRWLRISGKDIEKSERWFDEHGAKAVLFCRLVPGVRSLISIPAGIADMNLVPFLLFTALGSGVWAGILAYSGYLLAENYELVGRYLGPATYVVLGALLVAAIIWIARRKPARSTSVNDR